MTSQQQADLLLAEYQAQRTLRSVDVPPLAPEPDADSYERDLDVLRAVMARDGGGVA